jgi:hypothetical protein
MQQCAMMGMTMHHAKKKKKSTDMYVSYKQNRVSAHVIFVDSPPWPTLPCPVQTVHVEYQIQRIGDHGRLWGDRGVCVCRA